MTGVTKNLFVPLSLAAAFAMVASFLFSSSRLLVLFLWAHRESGRGTPWPAARRLWATGWRAPTTISPCPSAWPSASRQHR